MIFPLVRDFADVFAAMPREHARFRILKLLDEAIRRDVHFLHRHPTAFFQCAWNSCWWYDCPVASEHYDAPLDGWTRDSQPWCLEGPKLYELIQSWKDDLARRNTLPSWVRSLRPPPVPLGTGLQTILRGHESSVVTIAIAPDQWRIASGSSDGEIRVWNLDSGEHLRCLRGHEKLVRCVAFSPDGLQIASASEDGSIRVWDAQSGLELACMKLPDEYVFAVSFSPDGNWLAVGSTETSVRIFRTNDWVEEGHLPGHKKAVYSLAFSPDGRWLATASGDRTIRVWNSPTFEENALFRGPPKGFDESSYNLQLLDLVLDRLQGSPEGVIRVAFSPDSNFLVSCAHDGLIQTWDLASFCEVTRWQGHNHPVCCVAFSRDGKRIASGSQDGSLRLWDGATGANLARTKLGEFVMDVAFTPDGRIITCEGKLIQIWDEAGGTEPARLRGHKAAVWSLQYHPNGDKAASSSIDGSIYLWHCDRTHWHLGEPLVQLPIAEYKAGPTAPVANRSEVDEIDTDELMKRVSANLPAAAKNVLGLSVEVCGIFALAFSPDGNFLATGSEDRVIRLWNLQLGTVQAYFHGHTAEVRCLNYSPDGRWLASGSSDRSVRVWDASTGDLIHTLQGHSEWVRSVAFSKDGHRLASGSIDSTIRVWDVHSGVELACMRGSSEIFDVRFSTNDRVFATSGDLIRREWEISTAQCLLEQPGISDISTLVSNSSHPSCQVIALKFETEVQDSCSNQAIAWFPEALSHMVTHPRFPLLSGAVGEHVYSLTLE